MRTLLAVAPPAAVLLLALASSGCQSAFPPSSFDPGRGASPLERGALRVQAGGGGGVAPLFTAAGGALGARVEAQVSDHIAVGIDGGAGVQAIGADGIFVFPFGAHVSTQVNPGLDWLALRGSLGVGVDASNLQSAVLRNQYGSFDSYPWVSGAGSLVLSPPRALWDTGAFDPFVSVNLGFRRYVDVGGDAPVSLEVEGVYESVYAPGATLGTAFALSDVLSLYLAANATLVVLHTTEAVSYTPVSVTPVASLQGGVAFHF